MACRSLITKKAKLLHPFLLHPVLLRGSFFLERVVPAFIEPLSTGLATLKRSGAWVFRRESGGIAPQGQPRASGETLRTQDAFDLAVVVLSGTGGKAPLVQE
jgi:hypothetical protein